LKVALIMSVRVPGRHQFGWMWRAELGSEQSTAPFTYFYDCVQDAQKAGYTWRFAGAAESRAAPAAPFTRRRSGGSSARHS
jgi:hypothetical protein